MNKIEITSEILAQVEMIEEILEECLVEGGIVGLISNGDRIQVVAPWVEGEIGALVELGNKAQQEQEISNFLWSIEHLSHPTEIRPMTAGRADFIAGGIIQAIQGR